MAVAYDSIVTEYQVYGPSGSPVNFLVSPPASLAAGDLWVVTVAIDASDHDTQTVTCILGPSEGEGWTAAEGEWAANPDASPDGWPFVRTFWKIATAGDVAAGDVEFVIWASGTYLLYAARAVSRNYTGTHGTDPIGNIQAGVGVGNVGGSMSYGADEFGSITVQNSGSVVDVVLVGYITNGSAGNTAPPGDGTVELSDNWGNWLGISTGYITRNAGSYAPGGWVVSSGGGYPDSVRGRLYEIKPAGGSTPPHARPFSPDAAGMRTTLRM